MTYDVLYGKGARLIIESLRLVLVDAVSLWPNLNVVHVDCSCYVACGIPLLDGALIGLKLLPQHDGTIFDLAGVRSVMANVANTPDPLLCVRMVWVSLLDIFRQVVNVDGGRVSRHAVDKCGR